MAGNGLKSFSLHAARPADDKAGRLLTLERAGRRGIAMDEAASVPLDPETAARRHLAQALRSAAVPAFAMPDGGAAKGEFKSLGTDTLPFLGTKTVKFRQTYDKIPVYGSLVTVELDEANELLAISSNLGQPSGVSSVAKLAPADALEAVRKASADAARVPDIAGRLIFYFDDDKERWRLVYFFEDVPVASAASDAQSDEEPSAHAATHGQWHMDYVVDAHDGSLVTVIPRTPSMATVYVPATDGLGNERQIGIRADGSNSLMDDDLLGVRTHDLQFGDLDTALLPGDFCINIPPDPWDGGAVSAHANAATVAAFLRDVLGRNGLDNAGERLVSSVNSIVASESSDGKEWRNAAWIGTQMVYGQRRQSGKLVSYAVSLDVVAHEMLHGLTDRTARLEYHKESGALNESYSDIFGILVSNFNIPDRARWNWQLGEELDSSGIPLRDLSDPTQHDQPAHMDDFVVLPDTPRGDWGGVHVNSGIHNKAAHDIMTATSAAGGPLFSAKEIAWLFYVALSQHLSRRSTFADSARGLELAALSLFRRLPRAEIDRRVGAIRDAFTRVGVASAA